MRALTLTVTLGGVAVALLVAATFVPWYHYSTSTGNQAPPGEPPIIERHETRLYPYRTVSTDSVPPETASAARSLGGFLAALTLLALVLLFVDARWDDAERMRRPMLGLAGLLVAGLAALLVWAAVRLPDIVRSPGLVQHETRPDGYATGYILAGFYLALAAALPLLGYIALRYASGDVDWKAAPRPAP